MGDASRVTPLPSVGEAFDTYRFPTDIALVDSLVETVLEPLLYVSGGLRVHALNPTCDSWLKDLRPYCLSNKGVGSSTFQSTG